MNDYTEPDLSAAEVAEALQRLNHAQDLDCPQMKRLVVGMMNGSLSPPDMAQILTGLHRKGESVSELVGAAQALRQHMTPIRSRHTEIIDSCGTGGGGANLFNISTAVALVVGSLGLPVAKHGNKRSTSRSGSSDVLEVLGVNIHAPLEVVERCLDEVGVCFCFAPLFHQSVKRVAAVRQQLPFPTIFNLIGPLCNPAGAQYQLLGVGREETRPPLAEAARLLGTKRTWVVHGGQGLGELALDGATVVSDVSPERISEHFLSPTDFGVTVQSHDSLRVDSPSDSARLIQEVLSNRPGPARDIVLINAAAAVWLTTADTSPASAVKRVRETLADGRPREVLERLRQMTR